MLQCCTGENGMKWGEMGVYIIEGYGGGVDGPAVIGATGGEGELISLEVDQQEGRRR